MSLVTRVLAPGKKFKMIDANGGRRRITGPKKIKVTESQAEAFKSHWMKAEVAVPAEDLDDAGNAVASSQAPAKPEK